MKRSFALGLSLVCLVLSTLTPAHAQDAGVAVVEELGRINGMALACKQPALSSRARNTVIYGTPKTRDFGEVFEQATSRTFLALGKGEGSCPAATELAEQLQAAEKRLSTVFAGQR